MAEDTLHNGKSGGWISQQITLPNLVLLGGLVGAGFVVQYRTEHLETKVQAFERDYVPREVARQQYEHLLYRLGEIDNKLDDLNDAKKSRRP